MIISLTFIVIQISVKQWIMSSFFLLVSILGIMLIILLK